MSRALVGLARVSGMRIVLLSALLAAQSAWAQEPLVLRYEAQRAIDQSSPGQRARSLLRERFERAQQRVAIASAAIRDLCRQRDALPADSAERVALSERIERLERLRQELFDRSRESLREEEARRVRTLVECAERVAEGLRIERDAASITRDGSVGEDVTLEIARRMDQDGCAARHGTICANPAERGGLP